MEKIQLQIGDIVKGIVKDTRKSHAIISVGDKKAILPSIEYSWSKDCNIKNVMNVGDRVTAVVIILSEKELVVSIKRLNKNPWNDVDSRYVVGQKVKGKVTKILSYGAFVDLEDGITGLLHKSEMSADGTLEPSVILKEDQEIEVDIVSIESDKKRISFSIK